jgi:NAD(P)H-hydrate epimerase
LVSVATRATNVTPILAARPELMPRPVEDAQALVALAARADVLAIGPGLGRGDWGRMLLDAALALGKPCVVDADALNLLARDGGAVPPGSVLTPHPGEAARLLGNDTAAIHADRFAAAQAIARRYGAIVLLKGAGTVIAAPDGALSLCPVAEPGMATGGMGDVLTGVIAALRAQGLDAWTAAGCSALAHARAAAAAARRDGARGLLAGDVIAGLRRELNP